MSQLQRFRIIWKHRLTGIIGGGQFIFNNENVAQEYAAACNIRWSELVHSVEKQLPNNLQIAYHGSIFIQ